VVDPKDRECFLSLVEEGVDSQEKKKKKTKRMKKAERAKGLPTNEGL
jgi:hypothetical protein